MSIEAPASVQSALPPDHRQSGYRRPLIIPLSILWNIMIVVACLVVSASIFSDLQTREIIITVNSAEASERILSLVGDDRTVAVTLENEEISVKNPVVNVVVLDNSTTSDGGDRITLRIEVQNDNYTSEALDSLLALESASISNTRQIAEFFNLGRPVQIFVAIVVLLPAVLVTISSFLLWRIPATEARQRLNVSSSANTGRYISMIIYFLGAVLSGAVLAHFWGLYDAFEFFVDGIIANGQLTLGFAVGYALFWIGSRFEEDQPVAIWLERIAIGIAGLTLVAILLMSDILGGFNHILASYSNLATWLATGLVIIFAVLCYLLLMLRDSLGELPDQRTAWQGWLMLMPNIVGFMIFFAGPLLLSFYLSFTDNTVGLVPNFIGFDNYAEILSLEFKTQDASFQYAQDTLSFGYAVLAEIPMNSQETLVIGAKDVLFWLSLRNTLMFCLLLLPLAVLPALALSLILDSSLPGMKFFRAVYFLPSVAAVVGTALIWRWLYTPDIGYYNYVISNTVGWLNSTFGFAIADPEIQWLNDPAVVLFSMVLLAAWGLVGYNTVLFLAGLQGIPGVLYEAAKIDGANRWQQFRNVTLPMLAPTTFFVLITTVVTGLQVFNEPYALFPSVPIPDNATTSVYYLYRRGFFFFDFGYASSIAWVLFIIIFGITLVQFRLQRNDAYDS